MKIPEFKMSGLRIIAKFRWIPGRFPNQDHHGGAVSSSYGMGLINPPDPMQVTSSKGVGQGHCCRVLYELRNLVCN
jgi:hypothetical protein